MNKIMVSLGFNADVSQAKKQIESLQTSLNNVMKMSTNSIGNNFSQILVQDLQAGQKAAAQLQVALRQAFNEKTGNLDLSRFNQSMQQSGMTLQKYKTQLTALGPTGQQAFSQLAQSVASAEIPLLRVSEGVRRLGTTFMNTFRYQLSASVLSGITQAFSSAFTYAQDLNKSLNNIRIVTGYSTDQMKEFAAEANKAAKALSTTTTAYTDASLIFYQQGLSGEDVKERADVVVKLANVTGQSAEVVSDQMTAIWNNFDDGSKSMEYYADVITKLGAATASSTDEISDGLEKFAAVSETVGLSYEMATAALATVTAETRQSADVVGTAFKTIFSRMEGLKLGDTLEDGTDLNKYSQALLTAGVNIKDQNGQLREMDDILFDLGDKWQTLGKDQQVALAQSVAGVRQYNQFIALMSNWDKVQENLDIAISSTGELGTQADIYADSWEAAKNRVTASLQDIYSQLIDDEFFIDLTNFGADFINTISNIIDSLGGLQGVLLLLGTALMKVFSSQIVNGITNLQYSFMGLTQRGREALMAIKETAAAELSTMYNKQSGTVLGGMQGQVATNQAKSANLITTAQKELQPEAVSVLKVLQQQADELARAAQESAKITAEQKKQAAGAKATPNEKDGSEFGREATENGHRVTFDEITGKKKKSILGRVSKKAKEYIGEDAVNEYETSALPDQNDPNVMRTLTFSKKGARKVIGGLSQDLATQTQQYSAMSKASVDPEGLGYVVSEQDEIFSSKNGDTISSLNERVNQFRETLNNAGGAAKAFGKDGGEAFEIYADGLAEMAEAQADLDNVTKAEEKYTKSLDKNGEETRKSKKAAKELAKAKEKAADADDRLIKGSKKAQKGAQDYATAQANAGKTADEYAEDLKALGQNTDDIIAKNKAYGEGVVNTADKTTQHSLSVKNMGKAYNEAKIASVGLATQITQIGTTMMTVGMALSSLKGLFDTWNNEDMSFGEKMISSLTTLGMIIPMVASSFSILNVAKMFGVKVDEKATAAQAAYQILQKLGIITDVAATASTKGKTVADSAETKGIWAKVAAKIADLAASAPLLAITLLLIAAIAAVVAIVWIAVSAFEAWQASTPEGKLEATNERMKELNESLEEAKTRINDIRSAFDKWQSAYNNLKGLTKGTDEWNAALRESNLALLELLNLYPTLRTMVIDGQSAIYTDANGIMGIRPEAIEVLTDSLITQEQQILAAQLYASTTGNTQKLYQEKDELKASNVTNTMYGGTQTEENENGQVVQEDGMVKTWQGTYGRLIELIENDVRANPTQDYTKEDFKESVKNAISDENGNIDVTSLRKLISQTSISNLESQKYDTTSAISDEHLSKTNEDYFEQVIEPFLDNIDSGFDLDSEAENFDDWVDKLRDNQNSLDENSEAIRQNSKILASSLLSNNEEYNRLDSIEQTLVQNKMASNIAKRTSFLQDTVTNTDDANTLEGVTIEQLETIFGKDYIDNKVKEGKLSAGDNNEFDNGAVDQGWFFSVGDTRSGNGLGEFIVDEWKKLKQEQGLYTDVEATDFYESSGSEGELVDLKVTTGEGQETLERQSLVAMFEEVAQAKGIELENSQIDNLISAVNTMTEGQKRLLSGNMETANAQEMEQVFGKNWREQQEQLKNGTGEMSIDSEEQRKEFLGQAAMAGITSDLEDETARENEILQKYLEMRAEALRTYDESTAAQKRFEMATAGVNSSLTATAEQTGFSEKALKKYAKQIAKNTKGYEENTEAGAEIYKTAAKQAEAYAKAAAGVDELSDSLDDNLDYLQDWKKDGGDMEDIPLEISDAAFKIADSLDGVFGIEADDTFVLEHLDLFDDMIEGAEGAGQKMRKALEDNYLQMMADGDTTQQEIGKMLSGIKAGTLDEEKFIESANQMIMDGKTTADDVNKHLNAIGYEGEVEEVDMSSTTYQEVPNYKVVIEDWAVKIKPDGTTKTPTTTTGKVKLLKPKKGKSITGSTGSATSIGGGSGLTSTGTSNINYDRIFQERANKNKDKSGSSGGSKKENKEKKELSEEKERYHEITKQIDILGREYDKLERKKTKATNSEYLAALDEEKNLLQEDIKLQRQYQKEIDNNLKQDRSAIVKFGAEFDDETGLITNYDELVEDQVAKYNAAVDKYNSSGKTEKDEEIFKKAEEDYEKFKELLAQYEETHELSLDQQETIAEKELEIWEISKEQFLKSIEIRVETLERSVKALSDQIDYLGYQLEKLEKSDYSQGLGLDNIYSQLELSLKKGSKYRQEYAKALKDWQDIADDGYYTNKDGEIVEADQETIDQVRDTLTDAANNLFESMQELDDLEEQIDELVISRIDEQAESFDKLSEKVEHSVGILETYQNIVDLMGKTHKSARIDTLASKIIEEQYNASKVQVTNAKKEFDELDRQLALAKKKGSVFSEEAIEALEEQWREAQNNVLESWEAGLEAAAALFEHSITNAVKNTEQALTKYYSLEEAQKAYDQQKELGELYVEEYDKLYQLNKLSRDINKNMSDMDSLVANQKLSKLLDEINKKRESANKMSQFELDMLQKQYDLRLAEIALEEAQQAKNSMRLMRDSQGNWNYVYTSDQTKIDEAQQKYDDAKYASEQTARERLEEMQSALLENMQNYTSEQAEIWQNEDMTEAEKREAVGRLNTSTAEKNRYYAEQIKLAMESINSLYGEDVISFSDLDIVSLLDYDKTMGEDMGSFAKWINDTLGSLSTDISDAYNTYKENTMGIQNSVGSDFNTMLNKEGTALAGTLGTAAKDIKNSTTELDTEIKKIKTSFSTLQTALQEVVAFFKNTVSVGYNHIQDDYEKFLEYQSSGGLNDPTKKPPANSSGSTSPTNTSGSGGPGSSGSTNNSDPKTSNGTPEVGDEVKFISGVYYASSDGTGTTGDSYLGTDTKFKILSVEKGAKYPYGIGPASGNTIWGWVKKDQLEGYDTGGYTGEWGPEGKLAMLHEKELVLNKNQTSDFLNSLETMARIIDVIDRNVMLSTSAQMNAISSTPGTQDQVLVQEISINADFPAASSADEIKQAFDSIILDAAQYASSNDYKERNK